MVTNLIKINTIRGLYKSNPYSVIALLTAYSIKIWTESCPEVFNNIIQLVKDETEQDQPEEIIDIINKLKTERPMSIEFRNLRNMIDFTYRFSVIN